MRAAALGKRKVGSEVRGGRVQLAPERSILKADGSVGLEFRGEICIGLLCSSSEGTRGRGRGPSPACWEMACEAECQREMLDCLWFPFSPCHLLSGDSQLTAVLP